MWAAERSPVRSATGSCPGEWDEVPGAFAIHRSGPTDGILVMIMLYGGNDGLSTVVPFADGAYYEQRSNIAVPANQVLPINGQVGLNPQLAALHSMYSAARWRSCRASAIELTCPTSRRWRSG